MNPNLLKKLDGYDYSDYNLKELSQHKDWNNVIKKLNPIILELNPDMLSYCQSKISKNICEGENIEINKPIRNYSNIDLITANYFYNKGIDVFNESDPFFNDICYTYTTNKSTDATLDDRKKTYYQNITFCENNYKFININYKSKNV